MTQAGRALRNEILRVVVMHGPGGVTVHDHDLRDRIAAIEREAREPLVEALREVRRSATFGWHLSDDDFASWSAARGTIDALLAEYDK